MKLIFSGEFTVDQHRQAVYDLLANPARFAPLLPTFHSLEMQDDRTALVRVKVGIGRISSTASTELCLVEAKAPAHARYTGRGKLMQGAYELSAAFTLTETDKGTQVLWQGEAELVGRILSLAGGGMKGYAEREIKKLIGCLQQAMSADAANARPAGKGGGWLSRILGDAGDEGQQMAPDWPTALATPAPHRERLGREKQQRMARVLNSGRTAQKLKRKEDKRLLTGKGFFVDDYQPAGLLHLALVRSPYAHARIAAIDLSKAEALPGVVCTLTGKEIAEQCDPFIQIGAGAPQGIKDYPLAVDKAVYQGDPIVAVIAETPAIAADGVQLVNVVYDVLPPVICCEQAEQDAVILHGGAGTNITFSDVFDYGDVDTAFEQAAHVVTIDRLYFHRFGSTALETNAIVAIWGPRDEIDLFANTIMTVPLVFLAPALRVNMDQIRLRTYDIGGSFGNKICNYPYIALAAVASRKAGGAPVKWVETRSEHMMAGGHGSERSYYDTKVALDKDGTITALCSRHVDDVGAYPRYEPLGCAIWSQVLPAAYKLRHIRIEFTQVTTNKGPAAPNRGYSRLPHIWFMERVVDICGYELGIAADEMRRRNYIPQFPYTTPNGCVYDSGDLPAMLDKAKALIGWDSWHERQAAARDDGDARRIGIGIGTTLDSGTNNWGQARYVNPEAPFSGNSTGATAKLDLDGQVIVSLGTFPQGQGHETTAAQVVAETLGIDPDAVTVRTGFDSLSNSHTGQSGTYASQFAVTGLSAAHGAAKKLKDEISRLACFALKAEEDELTYGMGEMGPEVSVKGTERRMNFWMVANLVNANSASLPQALRDITLNVRHIYMPPFEVPDVKTKTGNLTLTYALQLHIAVIELKPATCQYKVLDYAIVDDCGKVINPMIVEGQVHGAACHGIGAAMVETMPFDEDGNVISGSFTDYAPVTINNMPTLKCANMQSPSPFTFNGAKGMGEGGGAPLHAIAAALQNALYEHGIIIRDSHNSPMAMFTRQQQPAGVRVKTR